jgi:hypothetical protein
MVTCDPRLQKLATLEKGRDAEPADFTKIGFQEQSIFRASCPPSPNQGENGGEESSRQENFEAPEPFSRSRELARTLIHALTDFIYPYGLLQTCLCLLTLLL